MRNDKIFTRFQKILKSISIFILLAIPLSGFAQYDYEHYVPPFYCSSQVGKQEVFLSTNSEKDINVYIEDGQGNKIAGPFTVNRNHSETYVFRTPSGATYSKHSNYYYPDGCSYSYGIIGPKELNKPLDGHGLRIFSYDGPFFANIRHGYSNRGEGRALTHGFSLSAKGAYAKGKEFYSGHLYGHTILNGDPLDYYSYRDTRPIRSHSISVMAVEDGVTTVTFSGIKCKYITKYEGGKVVLKSITPNETVTVNLNKGQTYTLGTNLHSDQFGSESIEVRNGMNGTHITSTKDIVVNSGSWTAGAKPSQDIGFDQIVPVDQVRDKYIVMKGQGRAEPDPTAYHAGQERTIVVATKANTEIWVNEVFKGELAEPGDFMILDDIVNPDDIPTLFINSKGKDIYVYQTMCGTNEDWINIGLNFIPPLTALGMKEVVIPKAKQITSGDYISPTVTVLAQKNVNVKHNGTTLNDPKDILGSTEWVYYTVSGISGDSRFTGDKAINVAWTASSNTLGAAGYYSGFTKAVSPIHPELNIETDLSLICESYDDDIIVSIKDNTGRDPDFYEWYKEVVNIGGETEWEGPNFINSSLKIPAPNENTTWQVRAYYRDPSLEILFNGDFLDGYNGFDSYYELVTNNLVDPGQFAITGRPKDENPILNDFNPIGGWKMLLAYSKNQNDTIYRSAEMEVESKFNYIFKMHGRLAKSDAADIQSLKVLINNETIVENFRIDRSDQWQSVSALWRPNGARNASIKILNNNLNGEGTFFAIDSISFVQAVEDTDLFEAKVIPNYSYSNNGKTFQFCEGVQNSLDVSNGDTSWYSYSWSKKDVAGNYIDLDDVAGEFSGTKTHELIFLNPQQDNEGDYRCKISFKEEYKNCGTSTDDVHVDLSVLVDEPATVSISGASHACLNAPVTLEASVKGDQEILKWYIDESETPAQAGKERTFKFTSDTPGLHTVECIAENGCGLSAAQITIEVFAYPELTNLVIADHFCEEAEISMEAIASVDGTGLIKYYWRRGAESIDHFDATYSFTSNITEHQGEVYNVGVSNVYVIEGVSFECRAEKTISSDPLNIIPDIELTDLSDITLCEGELLQLEANVKVNDGNNKFKWYKNGIPTDNETSTYLISHVTEDDDDVTYKVEVWNDCDRKVTSAKLTVVPKMIVNGITASATGPFCSPTNVTVTFNDNDAVAEYKAKKPDGSEIVITNPYTFEVNTTSEGTWEFIAVPNCVGDNFTHEFTWNLIPDFGVVSMEDKATCIGKDVDFVVEVKDVSPLSELTYEWKDNTNTTIVGENTNFLSLMNVQDADLGQYKCIVTDQCGNSKTATANLSIEKVTTSTIGTAIEKCVGDTDFRIDIAYTGTPNFEWSFENKAGDVTILSESTGSLTVNPVTVNDAGIYYCAVTLTCGDVVNIQRELIVHEHVSIVSPADETIHICQGEQPVLNIEVNGDADIYTVSWTNNTDNPLVGFGDVNQVQLSKHDIPGTYTYKAKVTSLGNCDNLEKKYIIQVHEKPILTADRSVIQQCAGLLELKITESGEHNGISWWKQNGENTDEIADGNSESTDFVINPATSQDDDGTYVAKVTSDYCGNSQATITVDITNKMVTNDQSDAVTTVCEGETVSLFVDADDAGDNKIQYKWTQKTDPTRVLPNTPSIELTNVKIGEDDGEYTCELSNGIVGCGEQTLTFNVIINKKPKITKDPDDQIICETEVSVDFTVEGEVQGDIHYQWFDKDENPVGNDNPTLTVVPVDGQSYYCEISGDACGIATSKKATLTIIPKVAVTNPDDLTINDGADATFSVIASGEKDYSYQWEILNGSDWEPVTGAKYLGINSPELKITNALKAEFDGNQYRCVVTSDGAICALNATATSDKAKLTINSVNKIANSGQPANQVVCEGEDFTFSITGTKTTGLTYQWQYHTGDDNFKNAKIDTDVKVSTYTVTGATQDMENWGFRCLVSDGVSTSQSSSEVTVDVWDNIVVTTLNDPNLKACVDAPFSITVEASGENLKYKWYKVGDESTTLSDKATFSIAKVTTGDEGTYKVEVFNNQNCNNETRTFGVDVLELLTLDNPEDVVMCIGDPNPTFTVTANGDGPFTYQWYDKNDVAVGTGHANLIVDTPQNGQSYYCVVSTDCNTVTSKSALLTVVEPLAVTDPLDQSIADNGTAHFNVTASGEPNYTYQWQVWNGPNPDDWIDLTEVDPYSGVNTEELTVTNARIADGMDGKQYRCIVTTDGVKGCVPSVETNLAKLLIDPLALITAHPSDQKLCEGLPVTFTVEVVAGVNAYNWFYNDGTDHPAKAIWDISVPGQLTIANVTPVMNDWQFYCIVSKGTGSPMTTNKAKLTVWEEVAITTPVDADTSEEVCKGESRNLSVTATGDDKEYKWYVQGAPANIISTTDSYFVDEISANIVYVCEVSNDCVTESRTFTFTVRPELAIITPPEIEDMCEGGEIPEFSVVATGYGTLNYQWFENGVAVTALVDNNKYTPTTAVDGNTYYCVITDGCGNSLTSDVAELIVNQGVTITSEPSDITISDGENATFELIATGEEPINYQWQILNGGTWDDLTDDATTYSGSNTATLTITKANLSFNENQYRCLVSNTCSADVESATVKITVNALFKIFTQPTNLQACIGDDIEFEIKGTSEGLIYEWEYSTNGVDFNSIGSEPSLSSTSDLNGSKLKITSVRDQMKDWTFHCLVKDGSSADDTSNEVKVDVFAPVAFDPIADQPLCFGESKQITLNVTSGTTPLTYSWTNTVGTEVSTTPTVNIADTDNGNYEVTVDNGVCPEEKDKFIVSHYSDLSIEAWTNVDETCLGKTETLTATVNVDAAKLATTTYEWFKDDVSLGVTPDPSYTLVVIDKNQAGQYKIVVNDNCSTESVSGYINIYEPIVVGTPWNLTDKICLGNELNLEVEVTGDVKSYTWTHNGNSITATTNYLVAAVTDLDAGSYQCIVEDHCGNTFTYTTNITIMHAPSIDGDGIENLIAVCEGDPLVLGTVSVTGSYDDIEWTLKDGSTNSVAGVQLNLGDATTAMEGNYKVEVSNKCGSDISVGAQVVNPKPTLAPIANQTVCENEDVVFRAKATGRDLIYQWKIDGDVVVVGGVELNTPTLLMSGTDVLPADEFTPKVYIVECTVTNDNGCGEILIETAQLTVNPSTIILATLKNVVRFVGQDYTMTVDATGHNLSYTWTHVKDGVTTNLSEKTNSLTLTNIQFADEGYYNCEINGTCATRLATGKITVKEPVVITDGLVSLEEKCVGEPLSLSISATGQISSVKWFKDGFEIPGETNLTLYVAELKAGDAGVYTCKVEGEGAPVDGIVEKTTVRVYENTTLLAALGAKTICEGEELEWIPNVKGAANIKYKWFFGGVEVSDQKILNYNPTQLAHEGNYEVQVTGLCGNVTTTGNLEVTELPVVISVSDNVETCENTSLIEFSVSATGEELKYQWRKDGIDIVGKTSPVLSLTSIQLTDEANYTCKVYNSCSDVISDEMTLKVIPQLRILSEMADIEVCSGEEVMLTTDVEGNDVIYQWKLDGVDLTGENTSVLNLGKTSPDNSGYYTCIVSDRCTDSRSTKPTELTVHELPNSRILGRMVLCAKEDRVTYTTDAIPEIEYGWGVEGGLFAGPDKGLRTRVTWGELEDGELSIMITDVATGCESKVDSLVKLNALPDVNLALFESKGVCNESFTLSGGYPEGGIYWVDDISEEVFNPAEKGAGTYNIHYSYTDENGCSNVTSKTTLQVDPLPTVNITDDTTIGSCKPFKLSAETDESNIQWSPAADLDDANSMTPTFTPGKSQVLVATVMDEHGCTNMDLVELTVAPLPIVTTISDTMVGQCNQLQLLTDIVGDAGEITWTNPDHLDDPNTRSPRIVNAPEGTYTYKISVTDLYGCDAEGEVLVNMVADPELEEDKFACEGEKFEVNIAGMENPIWEDGYTDINRTIDQPGKYLLTVENKYGCGDDQNFVINPTPKPELLNNLIFSGPREIELVKDRPITIFEGQTVTLVPNLPLEYSPYYFEWEDGKEGSILQRYEVSETGKYKLTVRDNLGCIAKDSVNVEVKPVGIESPNAFTPNSSNDNDKFYLKDINYDIEQFEMYVYNRWGELLYKTDEVGRNGGWDGKYKGKLCPAGAYVWMVFINGELTNKGTFMLIR